MGTRSLESDLPAGRETFLTAGVDVGTRTVRIAVFEHAKGRSRVVATGVAPVQGRRDTRDARVAIREAWQNALREAGIAAGDIANIASTGTRARAVLHVGHFYRGLGIAQGARHLYPRAVAVVDVGVTQVRCLRLDRTCEGVRGVPREAARWASTRVDLCRGGQILEHLARRSGVSLDDLGLVPEAVWLYDRLVERVMTLLRRLRVEGGTVLAGGMMLDPRFVSVLRRRLAADAPSIELLASPEGAFVGAYGTALLAARRYRRLGVVITDGPAGGDDPLGEVTGARPMRRRVLPRDLN